MKRIKLSILIIIYFFVSGSSICSQEAVLAVKTRNDRTLISIILEDYPAEEIMENLMKGLHSEISYEIKVYKIQKGILGIFGDRLYSNENPVYNAWRDNFSNEFIIETNGTRTAYKDRDSFLTGFFSLIDFYCPNTDFNNSGLYILGRAVIRKLHRVPALNLLNQVLRENIYTTPWKRFDLPGKGKE